VTIAEAIKKAKLTLSAHGVDNAMLDAEVLLRFILGKDRTWVITHANEPLDAERSRHFAEVVDRRATREPLQYITGKQEFCGIEFIVTPDVLIPRPETELVVESAIRTAGKRQGLTVIDLCTGSGCIAVSLAKELPGARIFATDVSEKALSVARENARRQDVSDRIRFVEGDLFEPLAEFDIRGKVDILTANPPYIRSGDLRGLQPEVRDFEPEIALIAGPRGKELHQKIIDRAPAFLKKHGSLIMEMGEGQADALAKIVSESGSYESPEILKDLAGIERVIVARKL
jgi:release factor glutamine methyltransferase